MKEKFRLIYVKIKQKADENNGLVLAVGLMASLAFLVYGLGYRH